MALTFGSLFAGIGGLDLGFERAGLVCKWQVEIDDYATKVLEKHWPGVHRERDIRECGSHNLERVDVIAGGFPCQDISYAGRGAGLEGERSGLFFEAVRVVRQLNPRFVVLENVAALLTRGLDVVLGTLAEIGFDAEWHCVPAAAVGAPHIRDRVFIIGENVLADTVEPRLEGLAGHENGWDQPGREQAETRRPARAESLLQRIDPSDWWATEPELGRSLDGFPCFLDRHIGCGLSYAQSQRAVEALRGMWSCDVAKTIQRTLRGLGRIQAAEILFSLMREHAKGGWIPREFLEGTEALEETLRDLRRSKKACGTSYRQGQDEQSLPKHPDSMRDMPCEIASWDTFEGGLSRVASGVRSRVDRLRGLGNAIVPQVAELIGRAILEVA